MISIYTHIVQGPRPNCEDAILVTDVNLHTPSHPSIAMLSIADGVGGNVGGEIASRLALHITSTFLFRFFATHPWQLPDALSTVLPPDTISGAIEEGCRSGNKAILDYAKRQPSFEGMATTIVVGVITNGILYLAWAGDSRAYRYHNETFTQLTTDHSQAQELVDAGLLTPEQARTHPTSHVINNYLGKRAFKVETRILGIHPGDILLLCTDGLTDLLGDDQIAKVLSSDVDLENIPHQLTQQALDAGTTDNTSVVVAQYRPTAEPLPTETVTAGYLNELSRVAATRKGTEDV